MLTLYYSPQSCALASHIALEEAGAEYDSVLVDFNSNEQRNPNFLAINPKGRVPALVTDGGVLTETPAVLAYIAQRFPDAQLAPIYDPFAFGRVQEFNSYLCSTVHVNHAHGGRAARWADDPIAIAELRRKMPETVLAAFQLIEGEFLKGPWVTGNQFTICDAYLFTVALWLERDSIEPETQLPRVAEHRRRVHDRRSVKTVMAWHSR
ncbi:MAG: glutathione S-transferase family protein [Hyphomicrobiaceae bacterium]